MPNLSAVAAALHAYPWTRFQLVEWINGTLCYCAIGALLRYAGASPPEIARAGTLHVADFWERCGKLLGREYGITCWGASRIATLNDAAHSQGEASRLILARLETGWAMAKLLSPQWQRAYHRHRKAIRFALKLREFGLEWPSEAPPVLLRTPHPRPSGSWARPWVPKPKRPRPSPWP